ncbi:MAG: hypothetical protein AAGK17_10405 [Pseudomonadota bacterium]
MKRIVRLILAVFAIVASPAAAQSPFGDVAAMDDTELAEARGGFILPGGLDLDFAIFQETSVDGELVLRSSYVLAETGPVVSVEQVSDTGSVETLEDASGSTVTIEMNGSRVTHLAGRVTGSAIANVADNRTITTVTTVDIDLSRTSLGEVGSLIPTLGTLAQETASFGF